VCDLETSRMGAPYIYDISRLRVKESTLNRVCFSVSASRTRSWTFQKPPT